MKHLTLALLVLTATLTSCVDTIVDNDLTKAGINGAVREITQEKWTAVEKFGEPTPDEKVNSYEEHFKRIYNEDGNIVETNNFFSNGKLAYVTKNTFNQQNDLTETAAYDSNGDLQAKITYTYNKENNSYTKTVYDKDGNSMGYSVNQKNKNGYFIKSEVFSKDDTLQSGKEWKYDEKGNGILETLFDSDRQYFGKGEFKHDESGNTIEHKIYNKNDSLITTYNLSYEFDDKGNWNKAIIQENDQLKYIKLKTITYYTDKANKSAEDSQDDQATTDNSNGSGSPMGLYKNEKGGIYNSFEFKGESTVVIGTILGIPYTSSYVKDGNLLRIRTDKSDLLLTIKDDNTLIGEGFAKGEYKKE